MTQRLSTTASLYKKLKQEWEASHPNLRRCNELLAELKLKLTKFSFLPTSEDVTKQELMLARDVLEIGVQCALACNDVPSFERYISQLKCYYFDYKTRMPDSPQKFHVLGLNLLYLLSQYRLADFHTELELLPPEEIQTNAYIKHSVSLEQYLMEGCYNKIFNAKSNVPSKQYHIFMDVLLRTIRGEIATCLEKAYQKISLRDATRKLYLPNEEDTKHFGVVVRKWKLDRNHFFRFAAEVKEEDVPITNKGMAENALSYAKELEMIV